MCTGAVSPVKATRYRMVIFKLADNNKYFFKSGEIPYSYFQTRQITTNIAKKVAKKRVSTKVSEKVASFKNGTGEFQQMSQKYEIVYIGPLFQQAGKRQLHSKDSAFQAKFLVGQDSWQSSERMMRLTSFHRWGCRGWCGRGRHVLNVKANGYGYCSTNKIITHYFRAQGVEQKLSGVVMMESEVASALVRSQHNAGHGELLLFESCT